MFPKNLCKQPPGTETLERLKRYPKIREKWNGKKVRIYSQEHFAFWRPNCSGYTTFEEAAGVYEFEDAWENTNHCGPEKRITYRLV